MRLALDPRPPLAPRRFAAMKMIIAIIKPSRLDAVARSRHRGRRVGADGDRGARLRASEGQDRGLSRRRVRGEAAAEGEAGDRRARRPVRTPSSRRSRRPPTPARSATARCSCRTWRPRCASAPANATPRRSRVSRPRAQSEFRHRHGGPLSANEPLASAAEVQECRHQADIFGLEKVGCRPGELLG